MEMKTEGCVDVRKIYSYDGITDREAFENTFGGYNDFPPNWKKITEAEFVQSNFFVYEPRVRDHRQMYPDDRFLLKFTEATLYFFHDGSGVAISPDHKKNKVNYFSFDVNQHDYEEKTTENHLHVFTCKKCGYRNEVDSSG